MHKQKLRSKVSPQLRGYITSRLTDAYPCPVLSADAYLPFLAINRVKPQEISRSHGMRNEVVEEKWEKHRNMPGWRSSFTRLASRSSLPWPRPGSRLVDHARIRLLIESSGPGTD